MENMEDEKPLIEVMVDDEMEWWIRRWDSLPDEERGMVRHLAFLSARRRPIFGGAHRQSMWEDWEEQGKIWKALSPEAQVLCEEACNLWPSIDAIVRRGWEEEGAPDVDKWTVEALLAPDDYDRWTIWEARMAYLWGPCAWK